MPEKKKAITAELLVNAQREQDGLADEDVADENLPVDKHHHTFWEFLLPASGKCATLQGDALNEEDMQVVQQAIFSINSCKACGCWEETDKLKEFAIKWVKQNPAPISLNNVNYRR